MGTGARAEGACLTTTITTSSSAPLRKGAASRGACRRELIDMQNVHSSHANGAVITCPLALNDFEFVPVDCA